MLTRKQKAQFSKVTSMLGEDVVIKDGIIYAQQTLRIDGQFKGEINSKGALIIGSEGGVDGNIQCENIIIAGKVEGNVQAVNQVHIHKSGRVNGDITCDSIVIDEGGVFVGQSSIIKEAEVEAEPKPEEQVSQ